MCETERGGGCQSDINLSGRLTAPVGHCSHRGKTLERLERLSADGHQNGEWHGRGDGRR